MYKYYARFNDIDYPIVGTELPAIEDSSRETKFNSFQIDFRGKLDSDLPIQYQEIKIIQIDDSLVETLVASCYCESIEYPEFNFEAQSLIITVNVISPYGYASRRTITTTINGVALGTAISTVLAPLIEDGFTIEMNGLSTVEVFEIFKSETVEKVMNYLASKFKFIWYIDKGKKIYLKMIETLLDQVPVITIDTNDKHHLQTIKPTKTVVDYCNKLTIKNMVLISETGTGSYILFASEGLSLNEGSTYNFNYPISLSLNTGNRFADNTEMFYAKVDGEATEYTIDWDGSAYVYSSGITYDGSGDESTSAIILVPDEEDKTKFTGIRWNGAEGVALSPVDSKSALVPYKTIYIDPVEISKIKTATNTSGAIEKIVDANGKYFSTIELEAYASNLLSQNNIITNEVMCTFKGRLEDATFMADMDLLQITKTFAVNLPIFNIDGNFIVTDTSYSTNGQTVTLTVNARNYNLNESYLDVFRVNLEQESEQQIGSDMIVFYSQDNKEVLSKEIYVDGVLVND